MLPIPLPPSLSRAVRLTWRMATNHGLAESPFSGHTQSQRGQLERWEFDMEIARLTRTQAAAEKARQAAEAMQVAESQMAAARKALEESSAALEAAKARQAEAAKAFERWKGELDFSRQPAAK